MILAIDAGNTRLKWGLYHGDGWLSSGAVPYRELNALERVWESFEKPDQIVISNVAGNQVKSDVSLLLAQWDVSPHWIVAKDHECGVTNGYRDPAQLGCDRWASLIAARNLHAGYCLVVNAGTAVTVDVLSDAGTFLGGIIVPGLQMMRDSLMAKTDGVRPDSSGEFRLFPDNTSDAVYGGALQALAGTVERMHRTVMEEYGHAPLCILSGGSAPDLQTLLNIPLRVVDNLVLEGLIRIAHQ